MRRKIAVLMLVSFFTISAGFCAETQGYGSSGWKISTGAGYFYTPAFLGSKDYYSLLVPVLRVSYKESFNVTHNGMEYVYFKSDAWKLGVVGKFVAARSAKDSDGSPFRIAGNKTAALDGLDRVPSTFEMGGYAEYIQIDHVRPSLELRRGINGREGFIADARLNYENNAGPLRYSLGPRLTFCDRQYNDAYFSINEQAASRTGLSEYDSGAGILTYGVGARVILPVNKRVSLMLVGGYDQLGKEAKESSLIKERGARDQFTTGISVSYKL